MLDLSQLPVEERVKRYRALAQDARLQAAKSTGETKTAFIQYAGQWEQLAREAEEDLDRKR